MFLFDLFSLLYFLWNAILHFSYQFYVALENSCLSYIKTMFFSFIKSKIYP